MFKMSGSVIKMDDFMKILAGYILRDVKKNFNNEYCRYFTTNSKVFTSSISVCKDDGKIFEIGEDLLYFFTLKKIMKEFEKEIDFNEEERLPKFNLFKTLSESFGISDVFHNSFGGITIRMKKEIIETAKMVSIQCLTLNETFKKFFKKNEDKLNEISIIGMVESKLLKLIDVEDNRQSGSYTNEELIEIFGDSRCNPQNYCGGNCMICEGRDEMLKLLNE